MSDRIVICPVCKHSQQVKKQRISQSMEYCECPVCGTYEMPPFVPEIHAESSPNRKLSAWIREQNERGELVQFNKKGMIENILASIPDFSPTEKQLRLLQAIAKKSEAPGTEVTLNAKKDIPLAYASFSGELAFYLRALEERGLVKRDIWKVVITASGAIPFDTAQYNQIRWESAEELKEGVFDYICAIIGRRR